MDFRPIHTMAACGTSETNGFSRFESTIAVRPDVARRAPRPESAAPSGLANAAYVRLRWRYFGSYVNFWPPTLASNIRPPLAIVKMATPFA